MKEQKVLYADEGKMLTNGETYGKVVFLADGESADAWHEITDEEYGLIEAERDKAEGGV